MVSAELTVIHLEHPIRHAEIAVIGGSKTVWPVRFSSGTMRVEPPRNAGS